MNTKTTQARNFVAKHSSKVNCAAVHKNKKREDKNTWRGLKKGPLWDLI